MHGKIFPGFPTSHSVEAEPQVLFQVFCKITIFVFLHTLELTTFLSTSFHLRLHCYTQQGADSEVTLRRLGCQTHLINGMRWLRLVGSLKLYVSVAKEPYERDDILQKRPLSQINPEIWG